MSRGNISSCWGRATVARTLRFNGYLAWLCFASGALALPLSAEEVTVTVPPDTAAQDSQAPQPAPAALPSFTGGDKLKTPAATSNAADQGTAGTPPASSAVVKHKSKDKKPATADAKPKSTPQATADNTTAAAPAATAPADGTTKPVDKTKQAAQAFALQGAGRGDLRRQQTLQLGSAEIYDAGCFRQGSSSSVSFSRGIEEGSREEGR